MAGRLRHYSEVAGPMGAGAGMMGAERGITWAAMGLAGAQLIFLANVAWSARRGRMAGGNPWEATTLEWSAERRGERAAVVRGPYDYGKRWGEKDFRMQWEAQGEEE
jgi:cytochrome c oxidase subunit 1